MNKILLFLLLTVFAISAKGQQKVIPLYDGVAPGSESWTWHETEDSLNMYHAHTIYNISKPTLTVYLPDSVYNTTGTAIIVCPGGGFQSLSIMQEGYAVVKWLQKKGITAFLLKYRLVHTPGTDPYKVQTDRGGRPDYEKEKEGIASLAFEDTHAAIAYVRAHEAEYGVSPSRIGIIGFSAGGSLAAASALNYTDETRPDFVAPIYAGLPKGLLNATPPADAPPMFIAAATNDTYDLEKPSITLYDNWISSKHSAELHIYSKGSHGFGMNIQHLASDTWSDSFYDWLDQQGFITPAYPKKGKTTPKQAAKFSKFMDYLQHNDWAVISHYQDKNDSIKANLKDEKRIVFMGNSITEGWKNLDPGFFEGRPYIDRGISGQTTPQMLVRFREDVIDLKPAVVVILAGINDIAQNTGYIPLEDTFGNIASMAELARANHIKVVLSSVMPAAKIGWRPAIDPVQKIIDLNKMIKAYAEKNGLGYINYYDAMVVGDNKALNPAYTNEGLHPNLAGYKAMEPLAEKAIADALKNQN